MMKLTKWWLEKHNACSEAIDMFVAQKERDLIKILKFLIKQGKLNWANWLIVRKMKYKQYVSYAVYAAEQVLHLYERKHPKDKRPRQAIKAAKRCIENPTAKNKTAADDAATATAAVDDAAAAAAAATAATAAAATAATAAAYAAYAVAAVAYAAATTTAVKMKIKILKYGIKLLDDEKKT